MKETLINDPEIIDEDFINEKLKDHYDVRVQFSRPIYNSNILKQLDKLAQTSNSKLGIRFYGHYKEELDCKILEQIPNVKALSIDCVHTVKNIRLLKNLGCLEKLGIGIFDIEDLNILSFDNIQSVSQLFVFDTRSKAFNLEFLSEYKNLTYLIVCGHTKNIDAISNLTQLKTLSLNSISNVPLHFLNPLTTLRTLRIILGGRTDINEIEENKIEELDIIWVRGFSDLSAIKNFKSLKTLKIEKQIQLQKIQFPYLDFLEDVKILDCKSLKTVDGFEKLKALQGLRISCAEIEFENFINNKFPKSLKTLAFYTWKSKQDKLIRNKLDAMGYSEF